MSGGLHKGGNTDIDSHWSAPVSGPRLTGAAMWDNFPTILHKLRTWKKNESPENLERRVSGENPKD